MEPSEKPRAQETVSTSFGQYQIGSLLGRGGMGSVYEAMHLYLHKRVALKIIAERRFDDPAAVRRFKREMEAVGRLHHPNVVQALDAGEWQGTHYLAMEHIDGIDVERLAQRMGMLSVADSCEIVRQAALGLAHAHSHHLVHRDVKPSNLMISLEGRVVILDLGLAHCPEASGNDITQSGWIFGTPDYISPEQAEGGTTDCRCDIYSLGATLYRLLAGRPPFASPDYESGLRKLDGHRHDAPPPLEQFRSDLPSDLVQLAQTMMAKSPQERPQSAQDVAAGLERWSRESNLVALVGDRAPPASNGAALVATKTYSPSTLTEKGGTWRSNWLVGCTFVGGAIAATVGWIVLSTPGIDRGVPNPALPGVAAGGLSPVPHPGVPNATEATPTSDLSDSSNATSQAPAALSGKRDTTVAVSTTGPETSPVGFPANLTQKAYENLAPDEWASDIWYPLLNRAPESVYGNVGDSLSTIGFDSTRRQLSVISRDLSVLQLGTITRPNYTFEVEVFQPRWSGGFAFFFGLTSEPGKNRQLFCLRVTSNRGTDRVKAPFVITPGQYFLTENPDGRITPNFREGAQTGRGDFPDAGDACTIRIVVRQGRLKQVLWNGRIVESLSGENALKGLENPKMEGGFGVVVVSDYAVFQNVRIRIDR
ncbi:MAG: serine/threonine protein kinase [Planctomycetaceae bacterium]|nr:serine/threonine protein kinase [Planctomycetaceae bacterium]